MDKYDEQAKSLYNRLAWIEENDDDFAPACLRAIASALREAAAVQEGHIRDDKGVERKVLGTLQVLASGEVLASYHKDVWDRRGILRRADVKDGVAWSDGTYTHLDLCYSTREAAEAARKEVPRVISIDEARPTLPQVERAMGQVEEGAGNG